MSVLSLVYMFQVKKKHYFCIRKVYLCSSDLKTNVCFRRNSRTLKTKSVRFHAGLELVPFVLGFESEYDSICIDYGEHKHVYFDG